MILSAQARIRQQQRGMRGEDLGTFLVFGSRIDEFSIMLTDRDADEQIADHKRAIERLQRLRGVKAVVADNVVVWVYKVSCRRHRSRLRRRGAFRFADQ